MELFDPLVDDKRQCSGDLEASQKIGIGHIGIRTGKPIRSDP